MKDFKQIIAEEISKATNIDKKIILENVEVPKDTANGDYAFPCFTLAKELKKSPAMIATDLQIKILENLKSSNQSEVLEEVTAVNGFLNFKINISIGS